MESKNESSFVEMKQEEDGRWKMEDGSKRKIERMKSENITLNMFFFGEEEERYKNIFNVMFFWRGRGRGRTS